MELVGTKLTWNSCGHSYLGLVEAKLLVISRDIVTWD